MNKNTFRTLFHSKELIVLPVIHVLDNEQAMRNVNMAREAGCPGVFLINHDFPYPQFLPIIEHVRQHHADYWIGVNFLAVTGQIAFPVLSELERDGIRVDGYWADDARIDERLLIDNQAEAQAILQTKQSCGWDGVYFGGTAFKKQRDVPVDAYYQSASIACRYMDVVTTSGVATGQSADYEKMATFSQACADTPLALASGVTPENVIIYSEWVDAVLVATGINVEHDFYNIDPVRLKALLNNCRR